MEKYFNNAIIGNTKILCTLNEKGEILRLCYPYIDYFQLIHSYRLGIFDKDKINWLKDASESHQHYEGNILFTDLMIDGKKITIRDLVLLEDNVVVRKIKLSEPSNLIVYSKLNSNVDKQISSMVANDSLIQYCQEMYMATFTDKAIDKCRINSVKNSLEYPNFTDEDYISLSSDAVVAYFNVTEITLYITLHSNLKDCIQSVKEYKEKDSEELYRKTREGWKKYFEPYKNLGIFEHTTEKERAILERTIYMFALLSNPETGAVLASPDVDENYSRCGRYGYCWPRDALFINEALHILGRKDLLDKFYHNWAVKAQMENGTFEQRYYSTGELAPSWGLQIDETAAILIGLNRHTNYLFLEDMVLRATVALMNFIDEKGISKSSYDIWEERKGSHLYSTASIYYALKSSYEMLKCIDDKKYGSLLERIKLTIDKIKEGIQNHFIKDGVLVRSLDNDFVDISLLSVVVPFGIFDANDAVVKKTISEIERTLHMPNGGYMRYQWDTYIGGNTWIISSLWLALYYIEANDIAKARELFDWVTEHSDSLSFLPEQIEREGDKTAWVTALSWSSAMYVIVKNKLDENRSK